jgi:hypothetical protein
MRVDLWGDIGCPWCHIGWARFARGLESFEHRDQVHIAHPDSSTRTFMFTVRSPWNSFAISASPPPWTWGHGRRRLLILSAAIRRSSSLTRSLKGRTISRSSLIPPDPASPR